MTPSRPIIVLLTVLLGLLLGLFAGGCAAPSAPAGMGDDPYASVPEDFRLDVEVRVDVQAPSAGAVQARSARFMLFPDGMLHARAIDRSVARDWYDRSPRTGQSGPFDGRGGGDFRPAPTRQLNPDEVTAIWSRLRNLGFADPDAGQPAASSRLVTAPPGGRVILIDLFAGDRSWRFVEPVDAGAPIGPAATALLRHLAELAWIPESAAPMARVIPRRYHLGDDPYARYRTP